MYDLTPLIFQKKKNDVVRDMQISGRSGFKCHSCLLWTGGVCTTPCVEMSLWLLWSRWITHHLQLFSVLSVDQGWRDDNGGGGLCWWWCFLPQRCHGDCKACCEWIPVGIRLLAALALLSFLLARVALGRSRVFASAAYFCANWHEKMLFSFHPSACYDLCVPQCKAQIQL